jgi:hypothetical protein
MTPRTINFFWHGENIGTLEITCLKSFHRHGHNVVLHSYKKYQNLPDFIQTFDANDIMPISQLTRHKHTGSVSLGSNRYRYRLIEAGLGAYADCDMYCIKPVPDDEYLFGWEDSRSINGAILAYPPGSDLSRYLLAATSSETYIPAWVSGRKRLSMMVRRALGRHNVSNLPWGVWGPRLLTHAIKTNNLASRARPIDHFYNLAMSNVAALLDPNVDLESLISKGTIALHLWHNKLVKDNHAFREPVTDSPLHRILNSDCNEEAIMWKLI